MIVYRITRAIYHKDISGTGSRIYGGRWNPKGVAALYTAETRALSTLEYLVHTDFDLVPPQLKLLSIKLPYSTEDIIEVIQLKELPKNWKRTPPKRIKKARRKIFDQRK